MSNSIVSLKNICKAYDKASVLENLSWEIEQGDIVALLGKNGAGKSTLIETIMNLRNAETGELKLWNTSWQNLQQAQREKVGFVAQDTAGFEWMKVKDFLSYLGGFFPTWDENYSNQLRDRWNLDPKKKVGDLSGGQKQILHVIQALGIKPELMILDEPVAHLDPSMRRQFLSELVELSYDLNSTVIFSSHIVSDLERVANKVALLKDKQINHFYDVEQLKSSIAKINIASDEEISKVDYYKDTINWQSDSVCTTATIAKPIATDLETYQREAPHDLKVSPISLEDWYLEVNRGSSCEIL